MSPDDAPAETSEIRRAELKRLVATAVGGGAALFLHDGTRSHAPSTNPLEAPPRLKTPPPLLLDAEWCMVAKGAYVSMMEWREKLREGPIPFAWMGTQRGPGSFQPGAFHTLGAAVLTPEGKFRAASVECVFDRSPLRLDPSLDRWQCSDCGSAFSAADGRVLNPPAQKPLLVFHEHVLQEGKRFALLPPNARPPR